MKASLVTNISLLIFFLGATLHAPWPLLFILPPLLLFLLSSWLVPGGFAWRHVRSSIAPGPVGWPLLGSVPAVAHRLSHRRLADLSSSLGAKRLMSLSLGSTRAVISSHPDTAKEILSGPAFADRPPKLTARLLMFDRAIGFAPSGDYWRHLRRVAATSMFSPRRIAASEGLRQRVAEGMVARIDEAMGRRGLVEVRGVLQAGSLEAVLGSAFGNSLGVEEKVEMMAMVREGYELIGSFNLEDYFPLGGLLDFRGVGERCKRLSARVRELVGGIIERRRRRRDDDDDHDDDDFLGILMNLPEEEMLADSDMIAVLWEMIFRGADVVAILLEWIMARMVLHPDIQAQAQQEIDAHVGRSRPVRDSDVPNLRYLQAIVKEVLRLHPPGPLLSWARLAIHDVHVGKMFVPAGTTAMVNMWAIAHDGSIWKDPWVFRPERFVEEEVSVMGSDLRLSPFGSGRRVCPGRALGSATVHLWLARLLQRYTWLPCRPVQLSECLRLSLEMKKPLVCKAACRTMDVE